MKDTVAPEYSSSIGVKRDQTDGEDRDGPNKPLTRACVCVVNIVIQSTLWVFAVLDMT